MMKERSHLNNKQGLYDPANEHDACGVGLVVNVHGGKSHDIVESALKVLENMRHRGAEGADNKTGDGAGILLQIPHEFILLQGIPVPEKGKYGTGLVFFPKDETQRSAILSIMIEEIEKEGLTLMHLRKVPVNTDILGKDAQDTEPDIKQVFITGCDDQQALELKLYIIRKRIEKRVAASDIPDRKDFYVVSLSTKSIIYKGMLESMQLRHYFPDLTNHYLTSGLALVHSRFSTNTFPTWSLAQPFRLLAHNGEINTIRGNRGWMEARESVLSSPRISNIDEIRPIIQPGMSDSASLDNVLEFFVASGMSLPHAMAMLVPESFNEKNPISEDLKAFYEYHSILMEPWDGPAALLFSDGRYAGGMLDRNGLRPARYLVTNDGYLILASEVGALPIPPERIEEFVAGLPVERFFGIGEVTAEKMHRLGIRTGADLRLWNEAALVQQFGKAGHSYYGYARGIDEREVTPNRVRKSLGAETTFAEDTDDRERLRLELSAVREEVWNRVMRHEFRGKTVVLKLKFDNFRQITRSKTLFTPVDSAETLRRVSEELLAAADFHGRKIRLIGLTVGNSPEACPECVQLRFDFGNPET